MKTLSQLITATILCCLVLILSVLHARERWPANNYIDAMASGQFDRARSFLMPEVDAGNPQFQTSLANLHYLGLGGKTDFKKAAELYHKAASEGYGAAQLNLGHLYKQGLGVRKSAERAFGWYIHAKISDNPWADYYLSQLSVELTLTPLQMATLKDRWHKLDALANEPL
ncbi:MAG: tetratricopeptide repeat protein [Granulosicoccus sp.]